MDQTTVTCTDTGTVCGADILSKSDRRIQVALHDTDLTLVLMKDTPSSRLYMGSKSGLEFTSTGN